MTEYELEKYPNCTREEIEKWYDFGDIFMCEDELYYGNGKVIPKKGFKHKKNGVFRAYFKGKQLFLEITFKNNKKNGVTKFYSKKYKYMNLQQCYTNDKLDGVCQNFDKNGNITREETFINGSKEGVSKEYYDNNKIKEEILYVKSKKNGFARKYYDNGHLESEAYYVDDILQGVFKEYYKSGALCYEKEYKDNKQVGWTVKYYENGNIEHKAPSGKTKGLEIRYYKGGNIEYSIESIGENRNGKFIDYDKNGNITATGYYKNNRLDGKCVKYFKSKKIHEKMYYKNGKLNGEYTIYYSNGNIKEVATYEKGMLDGCQIGYSKAGIIKYDFNFKQDLRDGVSTTYDTNGEVESRIKYKKGIPSFQPFDKGIIKTKDEKSIESIKKDYEIDYGREISKDWYEPVITNQTHTSLVIVLFNNVFKEGPKLVKKFSGELAREYFIRNEHKKLFIVEDDELLDKFINVEVGKAISEELCESFVNIMFEIYSLKEQGIEQATLGNKDKKSLNTGNSQEANEHKNKKVTKLSDLDNKTKYALKFVNCSRDIEFLTDKIIKSKNLNFSICIYGDPGTGKSAYARYLADKLGLKVISKSAADILEEYVGNSEKLIAKAFEEAKEEKAMLIIDEVDSFLRSRGLAQRNWEVTLVNQMLTCMEDFEYPFICTTNYIDILDQASLRRFTFKFKFGFLKQNQIEEAFHYIFKTNPSEEILRMKGLTVSDFVSIKKECDILGIIDIKEITKMLEDTISLKKSEDLRTDIGFN